MKNELFITFTICSLVFLFSCSTSDNENEDNVLTKSAIEQFIKDNDLAEPLGTNYISSDGAILLYKGHYYEIWKIDEGVTNRKVKYGTSNFSGVSAVGSTEGNPYVTVTIAEEKIKNQAKKVVVTFNDGYEITANFDKNKAIAIPYNNGHSKDYSIEIYNTKGEVIYSN